MMWHMRKIESRTGADGVTTHRVRFRHAGTQTSRTFLRQKDAETFATLLTSSVGEALAWLAQREKASREADAWTFAEWFEHYVNHLTGVEERTRSDYRAQKRRYLTSLDQLPLTHITRPHVAAIVNGMEKDGKSSKTIENAVRMLASCLAAAVEQGHMTTNPAHKMRIPKPAVTADDEDDGDVTFLTHAEFATLLSLTPDHYKPLVLFLAGTGLRWSEATALAARHVDLTAGTVKVRRAWKRVPGEGFSIGRPKSEKSRRTVNAAPQAIAAIRPLLGKPGDLVFTTVQGKPVSYSNFHTRVWRPAVIRASVCADHMPADCRCASPKHSTCPAHGKETVAACGCVGTVPSRPGIHALRHSHASWLISLGIQLEAIQDQLGHESILTTRKVYGHLLPALGAQVAQAAAAALMAVEEAAAPALPGSRQALIDGGNDPQERGS